MEKLSTARQAWLTLEQALRAEEHELKRDAVIQRFEYTADATWKAAKEVMLRRFSMDVRYPKEAFQKAFLVGLVDEANCAALLDVVDDRNLTSHTYSLLKADEIFARIPLHADVLDKLLSALENA
jgi:nucleotidyltransferase substrate binding protein (TIGR01987 family)